MFATFKDICLALARESTFFVEDVTVNGPSDELDLASFGKSLNCNVTCVLPVCYKKSGINLLIFIINSPSPLVSGIPV